MHGDGVQVELRLEVFLRDLSLVFPDGFLQILLVPRSIKAYCVFGNKPVQLVNPLMMSSPNNQ